MSYDDKFRTMKKDQKEGFFLGFMGGSGLVSVLIMGLYNFFKRSTTNEHVNKGMKDSKGPESFEIIKK